MSNTMHCTAESPMPPDRDQMGQHWIHHGAAPYPFETQPGELVFIRTVGGTLHRCPNCGQEFYQATADDVRDMRASLAAQQPAGQEG